MLYMYLYVCTLIRVKPVPTRQDARSANDQEPGSLRPLWPDLRRFRARIWGSGSCRLEVSGSFI